MGNCLIMLASVFYYLIKMYFNIQKLYQYVWWDADCKLDNTSRSLHEMVWFTVRTLKSSHKITLGESAQLRNLGTLRGFSFTIQLFSAGKLHKSYFSCLTVSLLFFFCYGIAYSQNRNCIPSNSKEYSFRHPFICPISSGRNFLSQFMLVYMKRVNGNENFAIGPNENQIMICEQSNK